MFPSPFISSPYLPPTRFLFSLFVHPKPVDTFSPNSSVPIVIKFLPVKVWPITSGAFLRGLFVEKVNLQGVLM